LQVKPAEPKKAPEFSAKPLIVVPNRFLALQLRT
jgi:hypothetical protein